MLNYKTVNGYQIPDLKIPDGQATLGRYGRMRKAYLKEYRKMTFNSLLLTAHLAEIDRTAGERVKRMVSEMAAAQGVNEALKERDPMAWVGAMNSLKAQAEEIVLNELVYA